ncbi:MAG: AI-2E family transporter [Enterovibrio sp.]
MYDMLVGWYKRRLSDPDAISLVAMLLISFVIIYFFGHVITPFLVAMVLAYLLEGVVGKFTAAGLPRLAAVSVVMLLFIGIMLILVLGLLPTSWQQLLSLSADVPTMLSDLQRTVASLPEQYPELIAPEMVNLLMGNVQSYVLGFAENMVKGSLSSLAGIATILVYMILVPLLAFFLLKDKDLMLKMLGNLLPRNRKLTNRVGREMDQQLSNYIRGKVLEIVIVGVVSYATFALLGLRYSVLLAVLNGLSVLIPYVGAMMVTIPVFVVALFQWGFGSELGYLMLAYGIIQALDGNVLVPVLFSEAVNLHPVAIILAVLIFGGLWGFWGVFFAIPLATLVKAVINALPSEPTTAHEKQ